MSFVWRPTKKKAAAADKPAVVGTEVLDYMDESILKVATAAEPIKKPVKEREQLKPLKERMADTLQEGLAQPIGHDNKGFRMLQRMGFQAGEGLGKDKAGLAEPLTVALKRGRTGVGKDFEVDSEKRRRSEVLTEWNNDFRGQMSTKTNYRKVLREIKALEQVCESMDLKIGVESSELWAVREPEKKLQPDDAQPEAIEPPPPLTPEEALQRHGLLLQHLRGTHFYCFWCGTNYEDTDDLQSNCPGEAEEDH